MSHICYLVGLITVVLLKHSGLHQVGSGPLRKKDCRLIANKQITYTLLHCASYADHYNSSSHPSSNFHQLKKLFVINCRSACKLRANFFLWKFELGWNEELLQRVISNDIASSPCASFTLGVQCDDQQSHGWVSNLFSDP